MNEATIISNVFVAIRDNAALKAWCTTNYGRNPYVYDGLDPDDPPPQANYPFVALLPDSRATGDAREDEETGLILFMGIADATKTVDTAKRTVVYKGVANCIAFRRLVIAAAAAASLDDGYIAETGAEYDTLLEFPLFHITQTLVVRRPYQVRDDRVI